VWGGDAFTPGESYAIAQAQPLGRVGGLEVGVLDPQDLRSPARSRALARFAAQRYTMPQRGPLWGESLAQVYVESFDAKLGQLGHGTLESHRPIQPIFQREMQGLQPQQSWSLSFWLKISPHNNYLPRGILRLYQGEQRIHEQRFVSARTRDIWGEWARVEVRFPAVSEAFRLELWMGGQHHRCDHFWLQPTGAEVFLQTEQGLWLNNYPLR